MRLGNVKIGRKIGLLLGACVFLLVSLAGMALWADGTMARYQALSIDRMAKSVLIERVRGDAGAAALIVQSAVLTKPTAGDREELMEFRKQARAALDEFATRADSPTSKRHAAEMDGLLQQYRSVDDRILQTALAGKQAEALRLLRETAQPVAKALSAKTGEAEQWQKKRVEEADAQRDSVAGKIHLAMIFGSLLAAALATAGGALITRSITAR